MPLLMKQIGMYQTYETELYDVLLCYCCAVCTSYMNVFKESVTIWPVYAYTLAAQNTVIKLLMLILYAEDNTSMSYEDTLA